MLVLSRQKDQQIVIDNNIHITVVDVRGDRVRIGIQSPATYAVYRKELYDEIVQQMEQGGMPPQPRLPKGNGTLVLTRQRDEHLILCHVLPYQLGTDHTESVAKAVTSLLTVIVDLMIVDIRGDKVRIGITAPRDVSVHRQEVYDEIQQGMTRR